MTDTERPILSRRRMLTAALLVPAAAAVGTLAVASPAQAAPGGAFTMRRSQVMQRAKFWYDRGVRYDMGGRHYDLDWEHQYRTDCSGYVSMCWHTYLVGNGGYSTSTLPSITRDILWKDLKPGDALNIPGYHCMLFDSWSAKDGYLWYYDLADPDLTNPGHMRHRNVDANGLQNDGYQPIRYGNVIDG